MPKTPPVTAHMDDNEYMSKAATTLQATTGLSLTQITLWTLRLLGTL